MKLTLHISPCPNDTFIFDALVNRKIDTGTFQFKTTFADVQTLNEQTIAGIPDIAKISYGVLPLVSKNYIVLPSGGALGKGAGPLLIAKKMIPPVELNQQKIVLPGQHTTAHLLFSYLFPQAGNKLFLPFDQIEDAVLNEEAAAGVIIHENRFTYHDKGLLQLADLGENWETKTGLPIPLGGIVMKRTLPRDIQLKVNALIQQSLEYAYQYHAHDLPEFVRLHAQEMAPEIMQQHIDLYVNQYSLAISDEGKEAVQVLMQVYAQLHPELSLHQLSTQSLFAQ